MFRTQPSSKFPIVVRRISVRIFCSFFYEYHDRARHENYTTTYYHLIIHFSFHRGVGLAFDSLAPLAQFHTAFCTAKPTERIFPHFFTVKQAKSTESAAPTTTAWHGTVKTLTPSSSFLPFPLLIVKVPRDNTNHNRTTT